MNETTLTTRTIKVKPSKTFVAEVIMEVSKDGKNWSETRYAVLTHVLDEHEYFVKFKIKLVEPTNRGDKNAQSF